MAGKALLDTNIVIALFNDEPSVLIQFEKSRQLYLSCIVLGELIAGARKSIHVQANLSKITDLKRKIEVINIDEQTAEVYGEIKHSLSTKGRPIPDNDIWIAASAMRHDLTLVTRDGHFEHIDSLSRVHW